MKVKLVKVADYELDESKTTKIKYDIFEKMVGETKCDVTEDCRKMRVFASLDEFKSCNKNKIDTTQDVHILKNGNVCVFLKDASAFYVSKKDFSQFIGDATADTEENKGE